MAEQLGLEAILSIYDNGFTSGIQNAEKRIESFDKKINSLSNSMSSALSDGMVSFGNTINDMGSKLTNSITKPAIAATSALAAITVGKGFGRLVGIDSARAKLQGLGHDAKAVEAIMDNALASVSGTSFAMEDAANTAATAVAAGIKPGQELTRYLSLTADAAAIAGINMGEMGSIFNKIATSGVIQAEEMNQLGDRGIPIFQMLADEMGVSTDQVKELGSQGEISSKIFLNAIEEGFGGAAQIMGDMSFSASFDNIGAAISRIGANFLDAGGKGGGFFSQLKPLMSEFRESLGVIEDQAADLGVAFGESFGKAIESIRSAIEWFNALDDETRGMITRTAGMGATIAVGLGPALKIVGTLTSGLGTATAAGSGLVNMLGGLSTVGTSATGALGGGMSKALNSTLGATITGLGDKGGALTTMLKALQGTALPAVAAVGGAVMSLGTAISSAIQMIMKASIASFNIAVLGGVVLAGMGVFYNKFQKEIDKVIDNIIKKGPELIEGFTNGITSAIPGLINSGTALFSKLIELTVAIGPELIAAGMSIVETLVQGIIDNMPAISSGIAQLFTFIATSIGQNLPTIIIMGAEVLLSFVEGLMANEAVLQEGFDALFEGITRLIVVGLPTFFELGFALLSFLVNGITQNMDQVITVVVTLIAVFATQLIHSLPDIINAGLDILEALIIGIENNWELIKNAGRMIIDALAVFLQDHAPELVKRGLGIILWIAQGIVENLDEIIPAGFRIIGELIGSLAQGIKDNWKDIVALGASIANAILGGLGDALTLGMRGIGEWGLNTGANVGSWAKGKLTGTEPEPVDIDGLRQRRDQMYQGLSVQSDAYSQVGGLTPLSLKLMLGSREYDGFTDDIHDNNESNIRLRENY